MTPYQDVRDGVQVWVSETMARCPGCGVAGMNGVWRPVKNGVVVAEDGSFGAMSAPMVQWWGECPSCRAKLPGGVLRRGSGALEVETCLIEKAASMRARRGEARA